MAVVLKLDGCVDAADDIELLGRIIGARHRSHDLQFSPRNQSCSDTADTATCLTIEVEAVAGFAIGKL